MGNRQAKEASFLTEGRLLQELGERLVARSDVALMELIKNSYDADARTCVVSADEGSITITDDGHGMTEADFLEKWMHIATPDKQKARVSRLFRRPVTGSKGIGRFAVRFLGAKLVLESIALDEGEQPVRLVATFDWPAIDKHSALHKVKIPYTVEAASDGTEPGTRLVISEMRSDVAVDLEKSTRTELLALVNPYAALEKATASGDLRAGTDPGFRLRLPGPSGDLDADLASSVLSNYYARLTITHAPSNTEFVVVHRDGRTLVRKSLQHDVPLLEAFSADIRYFPRRAGMFQGKEIDGRRAWTWIRERGGVGIVDRGFRTRPYGFDDDDWLSLSWDSAHNRREWRASFMGELYPLPPKADGAKANPALYLPNSHQLIGAVFLESDQPEDGRRSQLSQKLTPSMDREGYVENASFSQLRDLVRGGLEMLAFADHKEQRRIETKRRREETKALRSDLKAAAEYVESVPGLSSEDRMQVAGRFTRLSKELDEVEDYYRATSLKLETMGLLGVLAGFVTHETQGVINGLERLLVRLQRDAPATPEVSSLVDEVAEARRNLVAHLDYSAGFIHAVHEDPQSLVEIPARGAAELARKQFLGFANSRGIEFEIEIDATLKTPPLSRALYAGVLLNFVTNALKATAMGTASDESARLVVRAWNEPKVHALEVADNGPGIPPAIQKRIWDPLFTTTSAQNLNPLGSGMGLGLTLVKQVVESVKGRVMLLEDCPGFSTCFRATFPRS